MNQQKLCAVLLPGMDGTGKMFWPLTEQFPPWLSCKVVSYPTHEVLSYHELVNMLQASLPDSDPYIIIAESFAGPLALMLAERANKNLKAIVLCATFLTNPRPWLSKLAPLVLHKWLVGMPPKKWMARLVITGQDAPDTMLEQMLRIHETVSPAVIINRLYSVFNVDVTDALQQCTIPLLHLYGKRDHLVLKSSHAEIQQTRPDITSVDIDGPHFLLQTHPEECMQVIIKFLGDNGLIQSTKPNQ